MDKKSDIKVQEVFSIPYFEGIKESTGGFIKSFSYDSDVHCSCSSKHKIHEHIFALFTRFGEEEYKNLEFIREYKNSGANRIIMRNTLDNKITRLPENRSYEFDYTSYCKFNGKTYFVSKLNMEHRSAFIIYAPYNNIKNIKINYDSPDTTVSNVNFYEINKLFIIQYTLKQQGGLLYKGDETTYIEFYDHNFKHLKTLTNYQLYCTCMKKRNIIILKKLKDDKIPFQYYDLEKFSPIASGHFIAWNDDMIIELNNKTLSGKRFIGYSEFEESDKDDVSHVGSIIKSKTFISY